MSSSDNSSNKKDDGGAPAEKPPVVPDLKSKKVVFDYDLSCVGTSAEAQKKVALDAARAAASFNIDHFVPSSFPVPAPPSPPPTSASDVSNSTITTASMPDAEYDVVSLSEEAGNSWIDWRKRDPTHLGDILDSTPLVNQGKCDGPCGGTGPDVREVARCGHVLCSGCRRRITSSVIKSVLQSHGGSAPDSISEPICPIFECFWSNCCPERAESVAHKIHLSAQQQTQASDSSSLYTTVNSKKDKDSGPRYETFDQLEKGTKLPVLLVRLNVVFPATGDELITRQRTREIELPPSTSLRSALQALLPPDQVLPTCDSCSHLFLDVGFARGRGGKDRFAEIALSRLANTSLSRVVQLANKAQIYCNSVLNLVMDYSHLLRGSPSHVIVD